MRVFVPKSIESDFIGVLLEFIDNHGGKFTAFSKSQYQITKPQYNSVKHLRGIEVIYD